MKDNDLRGIVLGLFYEHRRVHPQKMWRVSEFPPVISKHGYSELDRICKQLKEHDYIEWSTSRSQEGWVGYGKITALGVDIVEGNLQPSISITFDHSQTVSISGSNNIIGDYNLINVEKINSAISHSNFSEAEKAEAKSLWQKVSENKLLNTVIGSVCGAATKHVLESTQSK